MTAQKRTRRVNTKKQTIEQFKSWIEGIEELQPDGWHPDDKQWKLIRSRIDRIIEPEAVSSPERRMQDVSSISPYITPPPQVPAGVPAGEIIGGEPDSAALLRPGTPDNPSKTPNVDGSFKTPFA